MSRYPKRFREIKKQEKYHDDESTRFGKTSSDADRKISVGEARRTHSRVRRLHQGHERRGEKGNRTHDPQNGGNRHKRFFRQDEDPNRIQIGLVRVISFRFTAERRTRI